MANKPTLCTLCKVNPVWKNARSKEYRVEIAGTVFYGIGLCSACYTGLCTRTKTSDEGPIRRRLIKVGILPPEAEPTEVNDGKSRPEAPAASIPESKSDDQPAPEGNESRAGKLEGDEAPSRAETHPAEELPEKPRRSKQGPARKEPAQEKPNPQEDRPREPTPEQEGGLIDLLVEHFPRTKIRIQIEIEIDGCALTEVESAALAGQLRRILK